MLVEHDSFEAFYNLFWWNIKWPKSIDLATSYSYNSGGGGDEIYLKTSSNSSKLLQTPSKLFQALSRLVQTLSKCVQTHPNVSKRVQMHLNTPNLSKFVQISFTWKFSLQSLSLSESSKNPSPSPPLFLINSPYWPLVSIAFWTI